MVGLVLLSVLRGIGKSILVLFLLLISLFFIGARSELVGVVAVLPFIAYLHFRRKPLLTVSIAMVLALMVVSFVINNFDRLSASRQFQVFDLSESSSVIARNKFSDSAITSILKSPILGDFGGQVRDYNSIGSYAHNILSVWRQVGIFGLLVYVLLLLIPVFLSLRKLQSKTVGDEDLPRITASISIFSLVLILGAKPFFWAFPALAWGLGAACCDKTSAISATRNPKQLKKTSQKAS
jgi:hypothetical protein